MPGTEIGIYQGSETRVDEIGVTNTVEGKVSGRRNQSKQTLR